MRDNGGKTRAFIQFERNKEMQLRHMESLYEKFTYGGLSEIMYPEAFIQFQPEADAEF